MSGLLKRVAEKAAPQPEYNRSRQYQGYPVAVRHIHEENADDHNRYRESRGTDGRDFQFFVLPALIFFLRLTGIFHVGNQVVTDSLPTLLYLGPSGTPLVHITP